MLEGWSHESVRLLALNAMPDRDCRVEQGDQVDLQISQDKVLY